MRRFLRSAALFLALLGFPAVAAAQDGFPWHLYEPRTLRDVAKENAEDATKYKDKGQLVFTAGRPYSVKVSYTGTSRPMPEARKEVLALWAKSYQIDEKYAPLFENEYLFVEDGVEHWLPVQTPVSKYFAKELKKGDEVVLFVQFIGGKRDQGAKEADWLFMVNEFQKPQ